MSEPTRSIPVVALALFAGAMLAARIGLPEYAHRLHPVGLRGAIGMPWATAFNLAAFVVPGVLLAWAGLRLRAALAMRGWLARVGVVLVQLSALAFAAQGLLPLDPRDVDAAASRWHVLAWMLWWIAFVPGALLLAVGAGRGRGFAGACAVAAVAVPVLAVLAPIGAWVGLAQRLAFLLWFGWWLVASRATASRASASVPGSSPTARR